MNMTVTPVSFCFDLQIEEKSYTNTGANIIRFTANNEEGHVDVETGGWRGEISEKGLLTLLRQLVFLGKESGMSSMYKIDTSQFNEENY